MKKSIAALAHVVLVSVCLLSAGIQNISPRTAYEMTKDPATYLVDVRSIAEYYLVGHPEMAVNIPFTFWSEAEQKLVPNDNFIEDIKLRFKSDDILVFLCRSGGRSVVAARAALSAGFTHVFNVEEGFEGKPDAKGYRSIGGWKNSGLPYTFAIDSAKIYRPSKNKEEVKR
jgi:rhodanese-related sulfurtransferase